MKLLGVLLFSEKEVEEKKKILQDDLNIAMTKTLESEMSAMCNLSKGVVERGIVIDLERGTEITTLNAIQNLMETLKLTAEQAMEALKVPEAEEVKYTGMLKG